MGTREAIEGARQILKKGPASFSAKSTAPSPTLLLSPYAFDILDVLFRLDENELSKFKSASRFAREFDLNQPRLSLMMTAFRSNNLIELRNKIKVIPRDWWRHAFDNPAVKKRLTPFFKAAKAYYSRNPETRPPKNSHLVLGPPELLKAVRLIRDQSHYFWLEPKKEKEIKRRYLLIPGTHPDFPTWYLTSPARTYKKEAIISSQPRCIQGGRKTNLFRALWDLSYGDERMREVQMYFLRMILETEGRFRLAEI